MIDEVEGKILCGDSSELLKNIGDEEIDLIVTSPPYDDLRKYGGIPTVFDFDKFKQIADELARVLKTGGVIVWVVGDRVVKGSKTGSSFRHALYFMDIGLNLNDTMIWLKSNPIPVVRQPRYSPCYEFMHILSKGKPKTFNPIMRRTKCGGQAYHSTGKRMGGENGRRELNYTVNSETVDYNVWKMAIAQNKTGHPAVFPFELAEKHILSWSNPGDIVLDPFVGSGTVPMACIKHDRRYIGMDISEEYCKMAEQRIENTTKCHTL